MADELTTITFRLPTSLREKIKEQANAEERSEGAFIRFHLGRMFAMTETDTVEDEEPQPEEIEA